jgi:hypothetical protein
VGCTEQGVAFKVPIFERASVYNFTPPSTYPAIQNSQGRKASIASGVTGVFVGAGIGAAWAAAQKFKSSQEEAQEHPPQPPEMHPARRKTPQRPANSGQTGGTGTESDMSLSHDLLKSAWQVSNCG